MMVASAEAAVVVVFSLEREREREERPLRELEPPRERRRNRRFASWGRIKMMALVSTRA